MIRLKTRGIWLVVSVLVCACAAISTAQNPDDEDVRGSFLTSRPAPTPTPRRTQPKRQTSSSNDNSGSNGSQPAFSDSTGSSSGTKGARSSSGRIGLGYSIFMADSNGNATRVDPMRTFHSGDSLRVSLESNVSGYLYVFYTENDGNPQMLFPDARLIGGDNRIQAHVPYEVPSSHEADSSKQWFVFDNNPATERLYIVVSRKPLPGVPTGNDLLTYCKGQTNCTWQPPSAAWALVHDGLTADVKVSKTSSFGQQETPGEHDAATRGLGLDTSAPAPSVVRMTASSNAPVLVTQLDLVHK